MEILMSSLSAKLRTLLIYSLVVSQLILTTNSQPPFFHYECSNNQGNYTNNSPFKRNLDKVLLSISSNSNTTQSDYGYYNASSGDSDGPNDKASAKAFCRGGVPMEQCRACVNNSAHRIAQDCPIHKEAAGWYQDCQILYSNNFEFGSEKTFVDYTSITNPEKARDMDGLNEARRRLLDGLIAEAASGNYTRKSAYGEEKLSSPDNYTMHMLLDCSPDLSPFLCVVCLNRFQYSLTTCCSGSLGVRFLKSSCELNYEIHPIYASLVLSPPSTATVPTFLPPTQGGSNNTIKIVILSIASTISVSALTAMVLIFFKKRNQNQNQNIEHTWDGHESEINSIEMLQFDFDTIKIGTNNFSSENKLGQGGFGVVYKGKLSNGQYIAVKRQLAKNSHGSVEFKNEVLLMAKLQHRNLVRLLGFCLHKNERLLIYEFVHNGSLDHFIFDFEKRKFLDWRRRYNIISGIARGLLYLHEDSRLRIIHRDLKASNILLDDELNPKIAHFGIAKLFEVDETRGNTSKVVGTQGYMAPEYVSRGQFSVKSDVFSFGVLILEIMSGRKNISFGNEDPNREDLLSLAWKNWKEGSATNVIDETLNVGSKIEMIRLIHIGLLCIEENPADRPTIGSLISMLSSFSFTLPLPSKPAFCMHSNILESNFMETPTQSQSSSTLQTCIMLFKPCLIII